MKHSLAAGLLLALVAGLLAGCTSQEQASAPTAAPAAVSTVIIGYSAPELWGGQGDIQQSLERYARGKGWQLITTTSGGDAKKQTEQIKNFIGLGVSAIVAVPDDSQAICEAVQAAQQANIPFYTIDRATIGCAINMAVLSDNELAGRQSAEALVAGLEAKYGAPRGTVLEVAGNLAQNVAQLRGSGFNQVMKRYPEITIISKEGSWDMEKGRAIVREALATTPDLDAIYLHSDAVYGPATLEELETANRLHKRGSAEHILLAGVDGSEVAVEAIRNGYFDQASNQPIPDFGIVVNWIEKSLQGEAAVAGEVSQQGALWSPAKITSGPTGPQLFLATTSVTEQNVDDPGLWANQP